MCFSHSQVQQMELEVRSLDAATRRELSKKVDQYKKSLASLKSDHNTIREREEREGLFGDRDDLAVRFCSLCCLKLTSHAAHAFGH